jgi:hypothetical protein
MRPNGRSEDQTFHVLVKEVAEIFVETLIERWQPEMSKLLYERQSTASMSSQDRSATTKPHGSLWSINDIAKDSGTSPATWRKWILQRKIPVVRLGRSVRIKDSDYRKLIEDSLSPELRWEKGPGRFR